MKVVNLTGFTVFVNTTIFRFCSHMFILLLDNGLNADTHQEEINYKKVFCVCVCVCVCVCSTLCSESVYNLKAIHPYCAFSIIRSTR